MHKIPNELVQKFVQPVNKAINAVAVCVCCYFLYAVFPQVLCLLHSVLSHLNVNVSGVHVCLCLYVMV